jgi:phospholipase C
MGLTVTELRSAIDTIMILIMENRSFDHMLGHFRFTGARSNIDGVVQADLAAGNYRNPANGQGYDPFLITQDGALPSDLPHDLASVALQLGRNPANQSSAMNGFAQAYLNQGGAVAASLPPLGFMAPQCVPVTAWLADQFTVCNRWFSSLPTSTHPNKLMAYAGKSVIDDTATLIPDQDTVLDWLTARSIPWRVYHDGAFSFFALMPRYWDQIASDRFRRFSQLQGDLASATTSTPQVIILEPAFANSPLEQHPNDDHPPLPVAFGESFLLRVYQSLASAPASVAARTLLIIAFDEHGGFWDHVPPHPTPGYVSVSGRAFDTTGPRVPAIIVSPWVSAGRAISDLIFDHTSILQLIAERFAAGGGGYSHEVDIRSQWFTSLSRAIDLSVPRELPAAPDISVTAPITLQPQRPITSADQRAFAHALDGMLSSANRAALLAKYPEFHAWDAS